MRTDTLSTLGRMAGLFALVFVVFGTFLTVVRPWYLHWGSSRQEVEAGLVGDELVEARSQSTRAITIDRPATEVWPWLLQLGQDRGGFYSYELLENLVGTNMKNVESLRPELQRWKVGDKLWMYPANKLNGAGFAVLQRFDEGRDMVFATRQFGTALTQPTDGSWAFVLRSIDAHHSRLIVRGRGAGYRQVGFRVFERMVFEPVHFMMERKMMEGIKARAEGMSSGHLADLAEVSLFACCFAMLVSATIHITRWPSALRALPLIGALAVAFQLLTFVQPPWMVGVLIVAALGALFERVRYA